MKPTYVYPGTFCPPHRGHQKIAMEAAKVAGKVTVICSKNPNKAGKTWFTPEECKEMWMEYGFGPEIEIMTFDEFMATKPDPETIVMVRGIRNDNDIVHENTVAMYNRQNHNIKHFHYIIADQEFKDFSSTAARIAAKEQNYEEVTRLTGNPRIAQRMIEKAKEV